MPAGRAGASKQVRLFRQYSDNKIPTIFRQYSDNAGLQRCNAVAGGRRGVPRGLVVPVVPFEVFNFLFGDRLHLYYTHRSGRCQAQFELSGRRTEVMPNKLCKFVMLYKTCMDTKFCPAAAKPETFFLLCFGRLEQGKNARPSPFFRLKIKGGVKRLKHHNTMFAGRTTAVDA
jgi:hypothetical protein